MDTTTHSEVDMGYVQGFVNLIAQALVAATELPKQIEAMQADLTTLHGDLDRTKTRNIELDTLLGDTRRQRDEAEHALSQLKANLGQLTSQKDYAEGQATSLQDQLARVHDQLEQAKKERDDYGLKHMAAEDRASEAEAKLDKLREAMGIPKPEPKAEPVPEPQPASPPPSWATAEVAQVVQPAPSQPEAVPAPTRIYEGQAGFNDLNHHTEQWDNASQRYYRTA